MDDKVLIARRVANELRDGSLVNLGIGLPTMVPTYLPPGIEVYFQSENGIIGMAPVPGAGMEEPSLTDAGGGFGLGGVLTPTGLETVVAEGKQVIDIDGKRFLLEKPLTADFAIIAAHRSDYRGNLEYSLTARNFNVVMATAGRTVIAEPEHIVPTGGIPPDAVATPFICVHHIVGRGAADGR